VHGPVRITGNRQISLPKALLEQAEMRTGDHVHLMLDEDGTVRVVNTRTVSEWIERGRSMIPPSTENEGDGNARPIAD